MQDQSTPTRGPVEPYTVDFSADDGSPRVTIEISISDDPKIQAENKRMWDALCRTVRHLAAERALESPLPKDGGVR